MKKKISILLIIFTFISVLFAIRTMATSCCNLEIVTNNNSPKKGDEIQFIVSVEDIVNPIIGTRFTVSYDNNVLELTGQAEALNSWQIIQAENSFSLWAPNYEEVTNTQQICRIRFKVKDDANSGNTSVKLTSVEATKDDATTENLGETELLLEIKPREINVNVAYSTQEITNEPVMVTLTSNSELQELNGWDLSMDKKNLTKQYYENTEETIVVKDLFGIEKSVTISIANIDSEKPVITSENIVYGEALNIRLQDEDTGVVGWQVNQSETQPVNGWIQIDSTKDKTVQKTGLNAGTYYIWAKDKAGNIESKAIEVEAKKITIPTVDNKTYNAKEQSIVAGEGYNFEGTTKAINVSTNTVVARLEDKVNTQWSDSTSEDKTITWKILAYNLRNASIETLETQEYTGNEITPEPKVTVPIPNNGTTLLVKATDYTVYYEHNTNVGTATITVMGKGNYIGTKEATFTITNKLITATSSDYNGTYDGENHTFTLDITKPTSDTTIYYKEGTTALTAENYETGSTEKPNKKDAGEYIIQWYIHSTNKNYSDINGSNKIVIVEAQKNNMMGDTNQNYEIDTGDILLLLRHNAQVNSKQVLEKHPEWVLSNEIILIGDVNKNGSIDIGDILKLRRYMAAKNSKDVVEKHPTWLNLD